MSLEAGLLHAPVKTKRKSYKTLYLNEVRSHQLSKEFHEKLTARLCAPEEEAVYPTVWQKLTRFFTVA